MDLESWLSREHSGLRDAVAVAPMGKGPVRKVEQAGVQPCFKEQCQNKSVREYFLLEPTRMLRRQIEKWLQRGGRRGG